MPGTKNTPSMHHLLRRNVTASMVGLKTATCAKISQKGGPQIDSWKPKEEHQISIFFFPISLTRTFDICKLKQ